MAIKTRIALKVEMNLDGVPGWGDSAEDFQEMLDGMLQSRIPHYLPTVEITDHGHEVVCEMDETGKISLSTKTAESRIQSTSSPLRRMFTF